MKTTTTRTTITTTTTEKTTVKHKLTTTSYNDFKRFKNTSDDECIVMSETEKPCASYQRIYLKCFVCSKREYISTQATNSDILHSHWLEHGNDLSLNIYDSEIDSVLTRVVEFFHFPKQHMLEGKIQTIFILNSKEIRKTSADPFDDDGCIVLDWTNLLKRMQRQPCSSFRHSLRDPIRLGFVFNLPSPHLSNMYNQLCLLSSCSYVLFRLLRTNNRSSLKFSSVSLRFLCLLILRKQTKRDVYLCK